MVGQIVFTLFLLFFLLASGDLLYLKVVQSFDTLRDKRAYMAGNQSALGSYLGAITLINAGLHLYRAGDGLGHAAAAALGIAAFILNFTYLGAVTGVATAFVVALISSTISIPRSWSRRPI